MANVPSIKLASGYEMPVVGFGIWKVPRESCADTVYNAIKLGYRHFDGAWDYTNSAEAGQGCRRAIDEGLVKREDLFITSKLWNNYHKREHALQQAKLENEAWGLGYLDLFLIHFPIALEFIPFETLRWPCFWSDKEQTKVTPLAKVPISETWGALEDLVKTPQNQDGFVRSIGVSNFHTQLLYDLLSYAKIQPSVLQIEHHPYLTQPELIAMAQENNIAVTGYSTFGPQSFLELGNVTAKNATPLFETSVVKSLAEKYGKAPGQILLRWCTQRNIIVIPKSNNVDRLKQNLECCSFDMTETELKQISELNLGLRFNSPNTLQRPIRIFT
ncbi:NAD(P)H-dependent D-xylose reductase [Pseudomassariella vexata]|uniref:NAD(P)H-dependent D-xylose reductase n=1 Tax=Pseudomassariella vexata TaxID=1141098 RepID=A0A1Y2E048_9PEZI|nr:NAD(P)H-dependent D-xylose reductase [Pseudomassariella vexata]ORY64912.1 NAD(P)H-dependent D-xylose reductase [Pseudomassariella vexata]